MKLVSYNEENVKIGDLLQTLTLQNFIKNNYKDIIIDGYSDHSLLESEYKVIINGCHRNEILPSESIFIGIHTDYTKIQNIKNDTLIGCRDMFTLNEVKKNKNINGIFSGCSVITIPFYDGKRNGGIVEKIEEKYIFGPKNFDEKLKLANDLIEELKLKELVVTNKLHIAMICIAVGTPVIITQRNIQKEQFSIFDNFKEFLGYNKTITRESGLKEKMEKVFKEAFEEIIFTHNIKLLSQK